MFSALQTRLTRSVLLTAAFLSFQYSMAEEVAAPDTTAGRLLAGWIEFMNSRVDSQAARFNPSAFRDKTQEAAQSRMQFRKRGLELFGTLELTRVLAENGREITGVLSAKDGRQILLTLYLTPRPENLIDAVKLEPYRGEDAALAPAEQSDTELVERASVLMKRAEEQGFSGAVLLARASEPVFAQAYGLANRSYRIPNTLKTKFNLGSMNKMFTAVAVMQLVEREKLSLNDHISKYLDETWIPQKVSRTIQVKHLLSHSSGLGNYFNETFEQSARTRFRNTSDYKVLLSDETLAFLPGSSWRYSNTGFLLLGAIIEEIAGVSYDEYVRKNIYIPAGMNSSGCFDLDVPNENIAFGYWNDRGKLRNNLFLHVIKGGPAGGGYSTVGDLLKFSESLTSGKLLTLESTRELVTPKPRSPSYGYGFEINRSPSGLMVGHSGGFPGIEAHFSILLDKSITLIVLCNADESVGLVLDELRGLAASVKN
ncbi:MAG: serine hydrolase domain-containing protein [Planctomycetota bacterium]